MVYYHKLDTGNHEIRYNSGYAGYRFCWGKKSIKRMVNHMGMMLILGGLLFLSFFVLVEYLVSSAAIARVLKLFGYERPVLGWVPLARHYALGTVCIQKSGSLPCVIGSIILPNALLQWGWTAVLAAYFIPAVGYVLGLILSVLYFGTVYRFVYSRLFGEDSAVPAAVSSVMRIIFYIRVLACAHEGKRLCSQPGDIYLGRTVQTGGRG